MIGRAIDRFVPPARLAEGVEAARRARSIVGFCLVCGFSSIVFTVVYWLTLSPDIRIYVAGATAAFFVVVCVELLAGRLWWAAHGRGVTLFANLALTLSVIGWFTDGAESPALWWYVILPMVGIGQWTRRQSLAALLCGALLVVGWHLVDAGARPVGHDLPDAWRRTVHFLAQIGLLAAVASMTYAYEFAKDAALRESAETNRALERAREEAVAASRAKSAFLANMSHEIRTPLTAILGFTDVTLERFDVCSEEWSWLDIVRRNGQHLLQLINDILDLSRIEADKLEFERTRRSPFALVAEVASMMRARAETSGIALQVRFDTPLPETIETDPRRARQILINLVGNAIKFTDAGTVTLSAALAGDDGDARIEFAVADTGIGLTDAQLLVLFAPFTQGDSSTSRKYGGSGLGLAISQGLARKLGGTISAESKLGVGSTFRFSIPTGVGPEVELITHAGESIRGAASSRAEGSPDPRNRCAGRRILLAEDGPDNQTLIAFLLRRAGATVTIVDNGQSAVERALDAARDDEPYDVVLMDMQMPVLDGYGASQALRRRGYPHRIVALTANAMAGDRERCLVAGCDAFLAKPIDKEALIAAVAECGREKEEAVPGAGN